MVSWTALARTSQLLASGLALPGPTLSPGTVPLLRTWDTPSSRYLHPQPWTVRHREPRTGWPPVMCLQSPNRVRAECEQVPPGELGKWLAFRCRGGHASPGPRPPWLLAHNTGTGPNTGSWHLWLIHRLGANGKARIRPWLHLLWVPCSLLPSTWLLLALTMTGRPGCQRP